MQEFNYRNFYKQLEKIPEVVIPDNFDTSSLIYDMRSILQEYIQHPVFDSVILRINKQPYYFCTYKKEGVHFIVLGTPTFSDPKGMLFFYSYVDEDGYLYAVEQDNTVLINAVCKNGKFCSSIGGSLSHNLSDAVYQDVGSLISTNLSIMHFISLIGLNQIPRSVSRSKVHQPVSTTTKNRSVKTKNVKYLNKNVYRIEAELSMKFSDQKSGPVEYTTIEWFRKGYWRKSKLGKRHFVQPTTVKRSEKLLSERCTDKKSEYRVGT